MANILNLITTSSQNNEERYELIKNLLVKSDVPYETEEVNVIQTALLSLINNQLNQAATRHDGLKLLLQTLPRCSTDVLIKYTQFWISKAMQVLEVAQKDSLQVTVACQVLASLVISSKDIAELQKQISMQNVKQFIAHANSLTEERRFGAVFYLLAVLLYHYPEPCEKLQATIKKLILPLVDSVQDNLVQAGAKCFALLTFATERSFQPPANKTHLTGRTYSQILICNSLHETMDALFTGVTEIEHYDVWDKLDLPTISQTDVLVYYLGLERRFNNLCVFLGSALRGCGSKNSVSPVNIFKVLSRGLFVTPAGLGNENEFRKQILHVILPTLHSSLLHVLDAVVSGFSKELGPYAQTILQLLQQILSWTEKTSENSLTLDGSRPFKKTRIGAYKSLTIWLMHAGVLSGIDTVCEKFLSHLLKDIVPETEKIVLSIQKTHHMSKRALKRHRENQYDKNPAQTNVRGLSGDLLKNADLTQEALITLQNIILNGGCRLRLSFHETSQRVLVGLLYDCYLDNNVQTFYKRSSSCRQHLLKALKMLQLNPHPSIPPPTQYCLEIFQMAQNEADLGVSEEAKIGLNEIEKMVHPGAPTLKLPILVESTSSNPENKEAEVDVSLNVAAQSKDIPNSKDDVEDTTGPNSNTENQKDDAAENPTNISGFPTEFGSHTDKTTDVPEPENPHYNQDTEKDKTSASSPIEITLDSDSEQSDHSNQAKKDNENSISTPVPSQVYLTSRISDVPVVIDVDEPSIKRPNIESTKRSITENVTEERVWEKDSDDDTLMLEMFSDTLQQN